MEPARARAAGAGRNDLDAGEHRPTLPAQEQADITKHLTQRGLDLRGVAGGAVEHNRAHAYPVSSGTEMMPARKSGVSLIDKARQARSYAESGIEVAGTLRVHVLSACEARDLS